MWCAEMRWNMAAFATHEIFGEEGYLNLSSQELCQAIEKHRNVFHLGCQGPDLFFYNPFMLGGPKKKNLGSRMHETRMNRFFSAYLESLLSLKQREELETGISYFLGFLSHYALDAEIHPYVYSRIGYEKDNKESGKETIPAHHRLEAVMDKLMLMAKRDCMPSSYYPEKKIKITHQELTVLADLLSVSLTKVYRIGVRPENVKASYWCIRNVMKQIYDHSGNKKEKVCQIEEMVLHRASFGNMIVNDELQDEMDVMNWNRCQWKHPWKADQVSDSDAWELYDDALDKYQEYVEAIQPVLTGMFQRVALIENQKSRAGWVADALREQIPKSVEYFGNRSYHSGLQVAGH